MDLEIARGIVKEADESGIELQLHESYSGRGMYGKQVAAISYGGLDDFLEAYTYYVARMACEGEDTDTLAEKMSKIRWDSLGRGTIIY